jgi:hypothetical protein
MHVSIHIYHTYDNTKFDQDKPEVRSETRNVNISSSNEKQKIAHRRNNSKIK